MTTLKTFEGTLNGIKKTPNKITMLNDCRTSQGSDFSWETSCFKIQTDVSASIYSRGSQGIGYVDYTGVGIENPVGILRNINGTGTGPDPGISYRDLYTSIVKDGYDTNLSTYTMFETDISDLSGALNRSSDFKNIQSKYESVKDLRNELDNKMREIYNPEDQDSYILHTQSVYMTLSWTILATSVLYYLFVKL
jgi:hypothetical protein